MHAEARGGALAEAVIGLQARLGLVAAMAAVVMAAVAAVVVAAATVA
jgi:hypothetical protein